MCKYLAFKGSKVTVMLAYKHFSLKGPPISLISVLYISVYEVKAFLGGLSGDGNEFWAPVSACLPQLGGMECS